MNIPRKELEQMNPMGGVSYRPREETIKVCHALLQDFRFFRLLLQLDIDLAMQSRAGGCRCGEVLHRANFPRKPRCCLDEVRADYEWHLHHNISKRFHDRTYDCIC